jgi:hypothetical protein
MLLYSSTVGCQSNCNQLMLLYSNTVGCQSNCSQLMLLYSSTVGCESNCSQLMLLYSSTVGCCQHVAASHCSHLSAPSTAAMMVTITYDPGCSCVLSTVILLFISRMLLTVLRPGDVPRSGWACLTQCWGTAGWLLIGARLLYW